MKLRISYFNGTVLKKDITRFAPVWGLYSIFLFLLISQSRLAEPVWLGRDMVDLMNTMLWINLFYAGICSAILFGDLFHSRMCNALHAMPMRRGGWLLTHLVSGFLFSLIPNLLATAAFAILLQKYFYLALIWLVAVTLQFIFCFGVGVFSVMCAGNRLAMTAIYGIIHFLAALIYIVADGIYEPLLYGIQLSSDRFTFFSPVYHLTRKELVLFTVDNSQRGVWGGFHFGNWYYLFAITAIGILMLFFSLLLYRRRKLEAAGDFIALRPLKPVFHVIYTIGVGIVLYSVSDMFGWSQSYIFLAVGIVVGFFTGKMLLERTVKVFRWKTILGFVLFTAVLSGSLYVTYLDPMGMASYIPETENIEWMRIYDSSDNYIYEDPNNDCYQITDPAELDAYRQLHRQLLEDETGKVYALSGVPGEWSDVRILYQLKDGSTVIRYYYVLTDTAAGETIQNYLSDPRYIFRTEDWNSILEGVYHIEVSTSGSGDDAYHFSTFSISDPVQIRQLLEAVKLDCEAGVMAQDWVYHPNENYLGWLTIQLENTETDTVRSLYTIDINYYPDCSNTLAVLQSLTPTE